MAHCLSNGKAEAFSIYLAWNLSNGPEYHEYSGRASNRTSQAIAARSSLPRVKAACLQRRPSEPGHAKHSAVQGVIRNAYLQEQHRTRHLLVSVCSCWMYRINGRTNSSDILNR